MGKSLKGRELGIGLSQRPNGLYTARFTDKEGKRHQKYSKKLQDCRQWLLDIQVQDSSHNSDSPLETDNPTVSSWFEFWMEDLKKPTIRQVTADGYVDIFNAHIKPQIGDMQIKDVRALHIQHMLNLEKDNSRKSTIRKVRTVTRMLFCSAVENRLIDESPVTETVKVPKITKAKKPIRVLTLDEQKLFLDLVKNSPYCSEYQFILQTGLRIGEVSGLKWEDVDFEKRTIHVRRSAYILKRKWIVSPPKTPDGDRLIPMTGEAVRILRTKQENYKEFPESEFNGHIFLASSGVPRQRSNYNKCLRAIAGKMNVPVFSVHSLRHTFATRCIESGMTPKTLQKILGHSDLSITMNLYVHVMEDTKQKEMKAFESMMNSQKL